MGQETAKAAAAVPPAEGVAAPQQHTSEMQARLDAAWKRDLDKNSHGFALSELGVR